MDEQSFAFGPFVVVPAQRVLLEDGRKVRLGSRALDILIALLGRAGEVVSKSELMSLAWPNLHVEEANLRIHIGALRKVLGDHNTGARFIENVPGRGYCFVGKVTNRTAEAAIPPSKSTPALVASTVTQ